MSLVGILALGLWWSSSRHVGVFRVRGPGPAPARPPGSTAPINLAGTFVKGDATPSALTGSWPRFRGAGLDNICADPTPLARSWGPKGPDLLWTAELGEGYAGAAVAKGRVYVLDYDQPNQKDVLRCLSLDDGREIWSRAYPVKVKRNHGMSRTVPAVAGNYVVSLGPKCQVLCVKADSGDFVWGFDLVRQFRTKVPPWYAGQCPLIDGNRVILAPGGSALLMAVDLPTGKVIWQTPNPNRWNMSHSSVIPMEFAGRKTYVYCAAGGVVGVSAKDGSILWETNEWRISIATVPTPIPVGDGRIFLCGGYESGAMMLKLTEQAGKIVPQTLFRLKPAEFGSEQQTPVLYQGYLYGVIPDGEMVCMDLDGKRKWASGPTNRFGLGPYVIADGMIYVLNDSGTLSLIEATPDGYKPLAKAQVLKGHDCWGPLAVVDGRLLARDLTTMVCLDIAKR